MAFQKTTAILYVCSIKFVVVIFIAQSDHAMVGTFVSYPFYTTDNGKKNPKIYDISISILGHCAI